MRDVIELLGVVRRLEPYSSRGAASGTKRGMLNQKRVVERWGFVPGTSSLDEKPNVPPKE